MFCRSPLSSNAMIWRMRLPGNSGAARPQAAVCPSMGDIESWYAERNFPALCAALTEGEASPVLLDLARAHLEGRLAAVSMAAPEIAQAVSNPADDQATDFWFGEVRPVVAGSKALPPPFGHRFPEPELQSWSTPELPSEAEPAGSLFAEGASGGRHLLATALSFLAPWLSGEGVELRRISQAATSDRPLHALLFGVYDRWVARRCSAEAFARLAAACGVELPALGEELLCPPDPATASLYDAVFVRLALSCFPARRFPEVLGYAQAETHADPPRWSLLASFLAHDGDAVALSAYRSVRTKRAAQQQSVLGGIVATYLEGLGRDPATGESLRQRVAHGIALHASLEEQVFAALRQWLTRSTDESSEVAEILRRKARFAKGYHSRVILAGRSLDEWFGNEPFDAQALLQALAASSWVNRKCPQKSPILDLLGFDGPMFGVFTAYEQVVVRAWLDSLGTEREPMAASCGLDLAPTGGGGADARQYAAPSEGGDRLSAERTPPCAVRQTRRIAIADPERLTTRLLFHRLVTVENHPEVLTKARRHAEGCLEAAGRDRQQRHRYFPYRRSAFNAWLEGLYRDQMVSSKRPLERPRLSREAYVFGLHQLAPAILVDGCWLQRVGDLRQESSGVTSRLLSIYADEVGGGNVQHNHPQVYRRLLESLRIELPPVDSQAFADHPGFIDAAFDLPVFLLSISLFPRRFLPELLGLNLAIELSGLGAAYSSVASELDYWGIDPQIVRLHQSIDNFASGHAALAKECVILHLSQVSALGGEAAVQDHWQRVWVGYASLRTVTRRFKFALVGNYLCRSAWRRVRVACERAVGLRQATRTRTRNG